MRIAEIIARYEKEKSDIQDKVVALGEREKIIDILLKELRGAAGPAARGDELKKAPAKERKARAGRKKRGGTTVREAILAAVAAADGPVTAGEIVKNAAALSGGVEASIRTQINTLTRSGDINQVPYSGRGFQYEMAGAKKASAAATEKKAPAKKPVKKARAKAPAATKAAGKK